MVNTSPNKSAAKDSSAGDVVDDNRLTDNVGKIAVSLEKQAIQSNDEIRLTDNVRKQKTAVCEYNKCGKEFVQTVSWKRFCCDDCRKLNWEELHGKRLNL